MTLIEKKRFFEQRERELIASWMRVAHFRGYCLRHAADLVESGEYREMFCDD